jgi:hypothetical protein
MLSELINIRIMINIDVKRSVVVIIIIIIIIIFQVIGHLWPVRFRILKSELYESIWTLVGLLGRVISQMQGLYLHRTTQHRKTRTHIHAPSGIRTREPSVRAVEDRAAIGTDRSNHYHL